MVPANATPTRPPLDGTRIAASSGAILFNSALLMLLLVPLSAPLVQQVDPRPTLIVPISRVKPVVAPEPPPPITKPVVVQFDPSKSTSKIEIVQPTPVRSTTPQTREAVVASEVTDTVAADVGTQVAVATPPDTSTGPLTGARLAYAYAPAPPYPERAVEQGRTGTVILEVLVGLDGKPVSVTIAQSSGQRDLDRIAVRHVLSKWRFEPAMRNGQPVQAIGRVPIAFNLE